jgi:hypothetical protein
VAVVTPPRIVLRGKSLDALASQVRLEYGPRARIVSAERVTSGGFAGLFARRYVEVTVELPERGRRAKTSPQDPGGRVTPPPPAQRAFAPSPAQRVGLAALLADAEDAEEAFAREETPPEPAVSTRSEAFAEIMDDLAFNGVAPVAAEVGADASPASAGGGASGSLPVPEYLAAPTTAPLPLAPALLDGPGDLVVLLGERPDVVTLARAMAESTTGPRAAIRVAGSSADGRFVSVTDRRGALEARASGVELDRGTLVAIGWDAEAPGRIADVVAALAADQIWIAVDAGRKPADTERWIQSVTTLIEADGLVVSGWSGTTTPETVHELGLPVGWRDA